VRPERRRTIEEPLPVILQRIVPARSGALAPLYWRTARPDAVRVQADGALVIERGTRVSFDTYFNAFAERHWRRHTTLREVALRFGLDGAADVVVTRAQGGGVSERLHGGRVEGGGELVELPVPDAGERFAQAGRLHFELVARTRVVIEDAAWVTSTPPLRDVKLGVVICTFDREAELATVLDVLGSDPAAAAAVARVFVVDQGNRAFTDYRKVQDLPRAIGPKVEIVRQGNFGGAGGFTRGVMACLDAGDLTHVLLMDDDIRLEPESVLRAGRFLAYARDDTVLAGQMLDAVRPTRLFEGGATVDERRLALRPQRQDIALDERRALDALLQPQSLHYGGWWFFAVPVAVVERVGLPLPVFIRGDDVEYGLRLHDAGVTTASVPGIGVWHEPFYVKLGGWQYYYEIRNMLVAAALHFESRPGATARQLLKWSLANLLGHQYYSAALLLRAVEDWLRGPAVLEATDPRALHAEVVALRKAHPQTLVDGLHVDVPFAAGPPPRSNAALALRLLARTLRAASMPVPARTPRFRVAPLHFVWFWTSGLDRYVVDHPWDECLPVYERDPRMFRALLARTLRVVSRYRAEAPRVREAWRAAASRLVTRESWRRYLGMDASRERVVAVVVTRDRPLLLARCLDALAAQDRPPDAILVVDNASAAPTVEVVRAYPEVEHLRMPDNAGPAHAFGVGARTALARGATHVWMMDDDGRPADPACLERLLASAKRHRADITAPLVLDVDDPARLSFALHLGRRRVFERSEIGDVDHVEGFAHFFNGVLVRADVFRTVGYPDPRLFIRGDEVEFYFRCRRAGMRIVLDTRTEFLHPSGRPEIHPILGGLAYAVVPPAGPKREFQFRNRGWVFRKYGLWHYLAFDVVRYAVWFLAPSRRDVRGFVDWARATWRGVLGRIETRPTPDPVAGPALVGTTRSRATADDVEATRVAGAAS
jgi:galactofuranosylgalactofuranosylrhamnosyl-N-acetylglucosaminyl-diphospho-decaprenol beta-1,5/1,6-galactofuranosyltransferase